MKVNVEVNELITLKSLQRVVEHVQRFSLGRYRRHLKDLRVNIFDRQRAQGGTELCCEVEARLQDNVTVMARYSDTDPVRAVGTAFERASRAVGQKLASHKVGANAADAFGQAG
jgi:hypothetical protein